jgi:Tol biopolymer transport system component
MRVDTVPARLSLLFTMALLMHVACTDAGPSSTTARDASPTTQARSSASASAARQIDLASLLGTIAFSAGPPHAEDIYVIDADGSGLRQVTTDPAADFDPTWSPDRARIAYRHQAEDDTSTDIVVIDADGSNVQVLTRNEGVADWGPAWSPDGSTITFNSDRDTPGRLRGFLMDVGSGDVSRIGGDVWVEYPAWSPDGSQLAFMAQTPEGTQNYEIFVMDSDGTNVRRLTDSPGDDGWPSWSPDGKKILFSSIRDDCAYSDAPDCKTTGDIGPYHTLYVMNADGSDQTLVSDAFGQIADWSPDGRFIVFEDFEGRSGLDVIRVDGSGLTTIPIPVPNAGFPDWIS